MIKKFLNLQRKQSRRVLKSKKLKVKLGANFKKIQNKLNAIFEKAKNKKLDNYHKISSELSQKFDLIALKDLKTKNITKQAKLKNVRVKIRLKPLNFKHDIASIYNFVAIQIKAFWQAFYKSFAAIYEYVVK